MSEKCPKCGAAGRPARYSDLFLYDCDSCKDPSAPFYQSPSCRIAELTEALKGLVPDDAFNCDDDWWCPECQNAVTATFEERCESCGTYLTDCQPSYEWAKLAKAALEGGAS